MIRYNAAHRGAERDVFPVTERLGMPVAAFTCLRWGKLLEPTPNDPAGFELPPAADWYRYALMHPAVSVALMAPNGSEELDENLNRLSNWRELSAEEFKSLSEHGQRVRECAAYVP